MTRFRMEKVVIFQDVLNQIASNADMATAVDAQLWLKKEFGNECRIGSAQLVEVEDWQENKEGQRRAFVEDAFAGYQWTKEDFANAKAETEFFKALAEVADAKNGDEVWVEF